MRLVLALISVGLVLPQPAFGQQVSVDTAAVVKSALPRLQTGNGAFVQLFGLLRCERTFCESAAAHPELKAYAATIQVPLVPAEAPMPACPWHVGHVVAPRGLSLFVSQIRPHGDQLAISVSVQCAGGPRALHSTFAESILLRVEEVEGRWTTTEVLSRAIT